MFFEQPISPVTGQFTGLEQTLWTESERHALLDHLYQQYQTRYVLVHGALGDGGVLKPSRPSELTQVVRAVTAWLPPDFTTVSGWVNLPVLINDRLGVRSPCTRVLALPGADLKLVQQHPDWWWRCEYVGLTSVMAALQVLPQAVMGTSFDEILNRLSLEACANAKTVGTSVKVAVEAIVMKAFAEAGVRLQGRTDFPSEGSRFQLLLTVYALLAHPKLSPSPFMEALTTLSTQAPLDYFTDQACTSFKGEVGFQQLVYEALMFPFALLSAANASDRVMTFTDVQDWLKVVRFGQDAAIFLPRVSLWLSQLD